MLNIKSWSLFFSLFDKICLSGAHLLIKNLNKHFKEPSELIDLLKDLEVSNLSLIQNCQDAEEIIESLRRKEAMIKAERYLPP